jgi:hypothetical protein
MRKERDGRREEFGELGFEGICCRAALPKKRLNFTVRSAVALLNKEKVYLSLRHYYRTRTCTVFGSSALAPMCAPPLSGFAEPTKSVLNQSLL